MGNVNVVNIVSAEVCPVGPQCKRHKHDAYLIIDGNNAKTLFGDCAVDLLKHVKSRSGDNDETQK